MALLINPSFLHFLMNESNMIHEEDYSAVGNRAIFARSTKSQQRKFFGVTGGQDEIAFYLAALPIGLDQCLRAEFLSAHFYH